jgi:hypothetical protein
MSDEDDRRRAKEREVERLQSELAEARVRGDPEDIASLEHELADLEVRDVGGIPIDQLLGAMAGRRPPVTGRGSWRWTLLVLGLSVAGILVAWLLSGEVQGIGMVTVALLLIVTAIAKDRSDRRRDQS